MTIEEWKAQNPAGAAQYDKPIYWFKDNVKCCYNCPKWYRDPMLIYNVCLAHEDCMTVWDAICDDWCGLATGKEENLLDFAKKEWKEN